MINSFVETEPAVVQTLSKLREDIGVQFSDAEWTTMGKIKSVLEPLEEATRLLSRFDASISMVIPLVTGLMKSLEDKPEDRGVLTWKRALRLNIETRFQDIEYINHYTVSTMLDSRYKHYFFRDSTTFEATKDYIVDKVVESLGSFDSHQQVISSHYNIN